MAHDKPQESAAPRLVTPPALASRHLLLAGVAGACALGVGLGLWARPAISERRSAQSQPAEAAPARRNIQIVVDDTPAPLGDPIEVLPAGEPDLPLPPIQAEPMAPTPPPTGLVRVQALDPLLDPPAPAPKLAPRAAEPGRAAKADSAAKPGRKPARPEKAVVRTLEKPHPEKAKLKAGKVRLAKARPEGKEKLRLAKAERRGKAAQSTDPKPAHPRLAAMAHALARAPHPAKAAPVRLAHALKPAPRPAPAPARPDLLARLEKVVAKASDARPRTAPAQRHVEIADVPEPAKVAEAPRPRPAASPPPRAAGPVRVAQAQRCAFRDPGAALVCADPMLSAADRRLQRAYRQAQSAGVPEWRLRSQQERWLAARSAAAREAPWAVHEVYQARLAELADMTRAAEDGDN
jgi:uncharacterized protein YecT (DUF1311 family)